MHKYMDMIMIVVELQTSGEIMNYWKTGFEEI